MKLTDLKKIVKEAVKEAIQEEIKEILLEAVRSPKHIVHESRTEIPSIPASNPHNPVMTRSREEIRESYKNILSGMAPGSNGTLYANTNNIPLQVTSTDTTSPNGSLPQGDVSMDMIMGLMKK